MSFGNKAQLQGVVTSIAVAVIIAAGLIVPQQSNAASNCTGPTFDGSTRTLSLVCTESTDIHELSCLDATNPDILFLSVNGLAETITCPPDVPPNTPPTVTVTGPASGVGGVSQTFTVTGTDAEGDALSYSVDWNSDTVPDYISGVVPSGTSINVSQSWVTTGNYTVNANATDSVGSTSAWVGHNISIASAPTAAVEVQVGGGPWSGGDQVVDSTDTVTIRWTSTDSTTCVGSNVATGNAISSAGVAVTIPAPGSPLTYSVTCSGPAGNTTDSVVVTTRQLPNLTVPAINPNTSGSTVDPATGFYDSILVNFQTSNLPNTSSDTNSTVTYRVEIYDSSSSYYDVQNGVLGILAAGNTVNQSVIFNNVPFGNNTIRVTVDTNNTIPETDDGDNVSTRAVTLAPADPNFSLAITPDVVREGQEATIDWDTIVTYPLNCTVSGPTISPAYTFNPNSVGRIGSIDTGALSSKSEYLLSCNEPLTNTTFTKSASVDVIPTAEEI